MTISKTARFLIGALLVAAAAFLWVNFFNQGGLGNLGLGGGAADVVTSTPAPAATPAPATSDAVILPGAAAVDPQAADASSTDGAVSLADGAAQTSVTPAALTPVDTSPPVIVTQAPTVATRDLVVDDLPFLITSPPFATQGPTAADAAAGAVRPQGAQRSTVNPFSPIVVQAPPPVVAQPTATPEPVVEIINDGAAPVTSSAATSQPGQTQTQANGAATTAAPQQVLAPPPRAVAPASTSTSALPRPLPSGTLPVTPEILRDARTEPIPQPEPEPVATVPEDVTPLAAVRVPEATEPAEGLPQVDSAAVTEAATAPEPLGPPAPAQVEPEPVVTTPVQTVTPPLEVGADPLSRYLRDNNVRFTGTALGPLSVGVFRSNLYSTPVVLTLGQMLPETDILLSDLRGYEARFSLGDRTQTLSLDLRR